MYSKLPSVKLGSDAAFIGMFGISAATTLKPKRKGYAAIHPQAPILANPFANRRWRLSSGRESSCRGPGRGRQAASTAYQRRENVLDFLTNDQGPKEGRGQDKPLQGFLNRPRGGRCRLPSDCSEGKVWHWPLQPRRNCSILPIPRRPPVRINRIAQEIPRFSPSARAKNSTKNSWKTRETKPKRWEAWETWKRIKRYTIRSYTNDTGWHHRHRFHGHDPLPRLPAAAGGEGPGNMRAGRRPPGRRLADDPGQLRPPWREDGFAGHHAVRRTGRAAGRSAAGGDRRLPAHGAASRGGDPGPEGRQARAVRKAHRAEGWRMPSGWSTRPRPPADC